MADIRNDQYLHRPGAGRGAITPADPLEVLLHSGGQPISDTNRLPVEATLSGSSITEAQAVPVRKKNAVATRVGTNVNVAAGALVTVQDSTDASRDELAVYARADASHAWTLYVLFLGEDGTYVRSNADLSPHLSDSGTTDRLFVQRSKVHTIRVHIMIQNNDTVSHTYNVWSYEWYL